MKAMLELGREGAGLGSRQGLKAGSSKWDMRMISIEKIDPNK
jgi:hypothetical protein